MWHFLTLGYNLKAMKTAILAISLLLLISGALGKCQRSSIGTCIDPQRICEQKNGICSEDVDFVTGEKVCKCVGRCRYDKESRSCVDFGGNCKRGECCTFAFAQYGKDGEPLCKCTQRDATFGTPCAECEWNKEQNSCLDRNQICEDKFKGCCNNWALTGPNKQEWDICICNKDQTDECTTCKYDKEKAACSDETGKCSPKNGKCCQLAKGFSVLTGLPKCECVDSKFCPQCQRTAAGGRCFDRTGACKDPNCCELDVIGGVDFCHCHKCWQPPKKCYYDPFRRICRNTGRCPHGNCCEAVGLDARGIPVCECTQKRADELPCSTCQWRVNRCEDPLGKCKGDKCCELVNRSCQCNTCEPPSSCRFDREKGSCVDINRQCQSLDGHCCKIAGIRNLGIPICKCANTGTEKCTQCERQALGVACRDPTNTCSGEKCCKEVRIENSDLTYCECQGCPKPCPKCLIDPDIRTCRNVDCPRGYCCSPARTSTGIRCDCKPARTEVCETCQYDRFKDQCQDLGQTCVLPRVCRPYAYLGQKYCFCLGPIVREDPIPEDATPYAHYIDTNDGTGDANVIRKAP